MSNSGLTAINHIVVLMLENRSFDHMLGFLYADSGNVSPAGFVTDFAYTLGWEAQEGRSILAGTAASDIMGVFTPQTLPVLSGLACGFAVCDRWFSSAPTETLPRNGISRSDRICTDGSHVYSQNHRGTLEAARSHGA